MSAAERVDKMVDCLDLELAGLKVVLSVDKMVDKMADKTDESSVDQRVV